MPQRFGHKNFYRRRVADGRMLVCLQCERDTNEPAVASKLSIVYERDAPGGELPLVFVYCARCGAKERLVV